MRTDQLARWVAWHLPKTLIYWACIRAISNATSGKWGTTCVTDLVAFDILKRWEISG